MLPKLNPPAHRRFFEFAQHLPCVSKRVTNVLLRQLHDNLRGVESSSNAWMCSRILSPFYVCFCCDYFPISLTESNRCELLALAEVSSGILACRKLRKSLTPPPCHFRPRTRPPYRPHDPCARLAAAHSRHVQIQTLRREWRPRCCN